MNGEVPPEVVAASQRISEKLLGEADKSHLPVVFQEIVKNDRARAEIHAKGVNMSQADWRLLKALNHDKKHSLRPGAEKLLQWNTDKGD